ncbi:hypothetical protein HPB47_010709, partial [Ixodes persulcatus]
ASEAESAKLQSTLESLRAQLQRLHSLELEGADLEAWLHRAEQERKGLERESARLRVALQAKDVSLDELSSRVSLLERENEQLRKDAQAQAPTAARARELEQLCQELTQKGSLDSKALTDLRQELVEEKLRSDQLTGELERIASSLELTTSLWKSERESSRETQMPSRDTGFLPLLCLEKTKAVLDEIENLSAVSAEEKRSKADREALLPKSTELIECLPEATEGQAAARRHLLQNGVFEEENWRLRSQLQALQEHTASLQGRATSGEQRRLSLQSQHAQLQVEAACLGSQLAALQQSASQLQERLGRIEAQKDQLSSEKSELEHSREALVRDHQVLEKLHEQLSADYQALASNLSCVKASCKLLKQENTALKEQLEEATLAGEVLRLAHDDPQGTNLRSENAKLKEEASALRQAEERTRAELDSLRAQHRALKDSHSSLRMDHSRLRGDLEESRGDLATARLDLSRLVASYEVLSQAQGAMQEERQRLLSGLSSLLRLYRGRLPEPSSSPGFQEECLLLRDLEAARDDLESCLRDYARTLDGSLSLCKEPLARARLSHLTCNVTEMEEVLGVSLAGIGNGLCARGRFPTDFGDLNGRPWGGCGALPGAGALSQDDQIPVRDVGPLSQPCPGTPALEGSKLPESLVFRDPPPTCSTPLGTPKQRQSPPPRPHVTVENHTTVNLVTHLNTTEPAIHFDKHQYEIGRQDGWKKLKRTAVPTLFPRSVKKTPQKLRKTGRVVPHASRPCTIDTCLPISSTPCLAAETLQCHSDAVPENLHAESFPQTDNPCKQEVSTWSQKESSTESHEAQTPEPFATELETKHQDHLYCTTDEGPQTVQSYSHALIEAPCVPASSTAGLAVLTPRHATPLKPKYEDCPCNTPLDGPQTVPPNSHPIIEDHCVSAASTAGPVADTARHTVDSQWNSKVDGHTQTDTPCLPGLPTSFQIVQLVGQPLPAERTLRGHLLRGVKFDPGVVGEKLGPTKVKVAASKPGVAMIDEGGAVVIALYDGSHECALGL